MLKGGMADRALRRSRALADMYYQNKVRTAAEKQAERTTKEKEKHSRAQTHERCIKKTHER